MEISSEMEQDECHHHQGGSSSGGSRSSGGCLGYPVNDDPMPGRPGPGPYNKLTCESSSSTYLPVNISRPVFQQLDLYTKFNRSDYENGRNFF